MPIYMYIIMFSPPSPHTQCHVLRSLFYDLITMLDCVVLNTYFGERAAITLQYSPTSIIQISIIRTLAPGKIQGQSTKYEARVRCAHVQ